MEDKLEVIYYQLLQMENRLDQKIEYLERAEKSLESATLKLEDILKKITEQKK